MHDLTATLFNYSTTPVKISIRYTVNGHANFKSSQPIYHSNSGQLLYPSNAANIYMSVLALNALGQYVSIFTDAILIPDNTCYKVSGTYPNLYCQHIPCPNFYNLCENWCYTHFKY